MSRTLIRATFALALTWGLVLGCSKNDKPAENLDAGIDAGVPDSGPIDAGPTACTKDAQCAADEKCDVEAGHCVPKPRCTKDAECAESEKCDLATGFCAPREPCSYDDDCAPNERCNNDKGYCIPGDPCQNTPGEEHVTCRNLDYCKLEDGLGCRCVIADGAPAPNNGYCKRRKPACAPCERDEECGNSDFFVTDLHEKGACVAPVEGGQKYCLELFRSGKCGCGRSLTIGETGTFCYPQEPGTCEDGNFLCCDTDDDCPAEHPLCDQATGRCRDVCTYDFEKQETVGCRSDLVCNVDPQFLDEASPNFGAGRCAPPCATDAECGLVGAGFKCLAEANSQPRCRPPGCLSDFECGEADPESPFKSYCQRSSGMCLCEGMPDNNCHCRPSTETDPLTGLAFNDCKPSFKCELEQCVKQTCIEQGGAELACGAGQFCCGEDRNGNGSSTDDTCLDPDNVVLALPGDCYDAPTPPWCAGCQNDDGCNGAGFPFSPRERNQCLDFGNGPVCIYACEKMTECPVGFVCAELKLTCDPTAAGSCGETGTCRQTGVDPQTGQPFGECVCSVAYEVGGVCPETTRCSANAKYCVFMQGCRPGPEVCQ